MRRYERHEFCKSVKCEGIRTGLTGETSCPYYPEHCLKTAKEFHKWLNQNLFVIAQPENEHEANDL